MKPKASKSTDLCAYRVDWFWRVVVLLARGLGIILEKITLSVVPRRPNPFTIGLTIFLAFDLVFIIAVAVQGNSELVLKDRMALVIAILFPLAAATAFSFYERLYQTFNDLGSFGILPGEHNKLSEFTSTLDKRCNSLPVNALCLVLGLLLFGGLVLLQKGEVAEWIEKLPLGVQIYGGIWVVMVFSSALFFTWKAVAVLVGIRELSTQKQASATGLRFSIDLRHPDRCGGLSSLSRLWLHINYLVVMAGIWIFGTWAFGTVAKGQEPVFYSAMVAYVLVCPLLFFSPFLQLHSLMVGIKERELEKHISEWQRAKAEGSEAKTEQLRKMYAEAQHLPTWPFNFQIKGLFITTYLFPFLIPIYELILRRFGD